MNRVAWIAILLCFAWMPGGCRPKPGRPAASPSHASPQRIVSLAPSVTEMLFAIGAGSRVVATDDFSNYPREAEGLPRIGGVQVNYEVIASLKPDLVVGIRDLQGAALAHLERLGFRTLALDTTDYGKTTDAIRKLGGATGNENAANAVAKRLAATRENAKRLERHPRPSVLFVAEAATRYVAGGETFLDELIRLAGGQNAASVKGFAVMSREALAAQVPPDVVLVTSEDDAAIVRRWNVGGRTPRVAVAPRDVLVRPGPRLDEGLRWLIRLLDNTKANRQ